jgi:hypothetical protein
MADTDFMTRKARQATHGDADMAAQDVAAQGQAQAERAKAVAQDLAGKARATMSDAGQQVQHAGQQAAAKAREVARDVAPQVAYEVKTTGKDIMQHALGIGRYAPQRQGRAACLLQYASVLYLATGLAMILLPGQFAMALHMIRNPNNPAATGMMRMLGLLVSIDAYNNLLAGRHNDQALICARILADGLLFPAAFTLFWAMGYISTGLTAGLNTAKLGLAAALYYLYKQDQASSSSPAARRRKVE